MKIFLNNLLYRRFLYSSVLGYSGRTLFDIAFIIYASNLSNPELAVGIASIATTLPYLISFILGYMADRSKDKLDSIMRTRFYQFLLFVLFSVITLFDESWYIFAGVVLVNVLSDILGGYNSYLSMSVNTRLVEKDDLSTALALQNSINDTVSLVAKAIGVFILGVLSYNYSYFGLFNAGLFLLALAILYFNKTKLKDKVGVFNKEKKLNNLNFSNFIFDTKENLKVLKSIKVIYSYVVLFCGMNFYSAAMHTLFLMLLIKSNTYIFVNTGYTIAFLEVVEILSMIVGGILPLKFYKNMSLKSNAVIEIFLFILYTVNLLYIENKILLVILTVLIGYVAGISNPKLDALILQSVPEDKQTSIFSIFGTLITITIPVATAIIVFLTNTLSLQVGLYILLILLMILTVYSSSLKIK